MNDRHEFDDVVEALRELHQAEVAAAQMRPSSVRRRAQSAAPRIAGGLLVAVTVVAVVGLALGGYGRQDPMQSPPPTSTAAAANSPSPSLTETLDAGDTPSPVAATPSDSPTPTLGPTATIEHTPRPSASLPAEWPDSLREALSERAVVFIHYDEPGWTTLRVWPFAQDGAYEIQRGDQWSGAGGHYFLLSREKTAGHEIRLVDTSDWSERVLGVFPPSEWISAAIDRAGSEVAVHGSFGDNNDCDPCFDNGVLAWDILTGAQRTLIAPEQNVATRWDMHMSPSGKTIISGTGCQNGDFCGFEVVGEDIPLHVLAGEMTIDAITDDYALAWDQVRDPDLNTRLLRRMLVDLRDGSRRLIPLKADGDLLSVCEMCLSIGVGEKWVMDDEHFLISSSHGDRFDIFLLDAETNTVDSIYGWNSNTPQAQRLDLYWDEPVLSPDWVLLRPVQLSGDDLSIDLSALNVRNGTLISLGTVIR